MGRRFIEGRAAKVHKSIWDLWTPRDGKYYKRKANKARRQAWKLKGVEGTPNNVHEKHCNCRGDDRW